MWAWCLCFLVRLEAVLRLCFRAHIVLLVWRLCPQASSRYITGEPRQRMLLVPLFDMVRAVRVCAVYRTRTNGHNGQRVCTC